MADAAQKDADVIWLDGHIDTVTVGDGERKQWASGQPHVADFIHEDGTPFEDGDIGEKFIRGKGSADQQGGYMAAFKAFLEIAGQIKKSDRKVSITMALMRNEEPAEGVAPEMAYEELRNRGYGKLKGAISTEPSNKQIMTQQMGRFMMKIENKNDDPAVLIKVISELAKYERISDIATKNQPLVLVGGDTNKEYNNPTESRVAENAVASFDLNGLDRNEVGHTIQTFLDSYQSSKELVELAGYIVEYKGNINLTVEICGQTAHSGFPERGINAGVVMANLVQELADKHPDLEFKAARIGEGKISADKGEGVLYYDYRCDAGEEEDPEVCINNIRAKLAETFLDQVVVITTDTHNVQWDKDIPDTMPIRQFLPAWKTDKNSPLVKLVESAINAGLPDDKRVETDGRQDFCTNLSGRIFRGIVKLILGAGDPGEAHNPNEKCSINEMSRICIAYQRIIRSIMMGELNEI